MSKKLLFTSALLLPFTLSGRAQVIAGAAAGATAAAPHLLAAAPAILTGAVSSASAHAGGAVLAKLASPAALSNGLKLPAGSQLLGHITQVTPLKQGNGASSLSMLFDRVRGTDGKESPLSSSILQSIGSGHQSRENRDQQSDADTQANTQASSGGLLGGVVGSVGNAVGGVVNTTGQLLGAVTGLPGVLLTSTGTLNAKGREVSVPAGTQISVAANVQANQ